MGRKHRRERSNGNSKNSQESWGNFDFESEDVPYVKSKDLKVKPFKAKTKSQQTCYEILGKNTLTFVGGSVGTGKTAVVCRYALECLSKGLVEKIVITRPAIEAGKSIGYLPGGLQDKMYNYLVPIYHNFETFIGHEKLKELLDDKIIECVPVGFMRGLTFNNTFLIIDEGQNLTKEQARMVLTRIGFDSFAAMTYDSEQVDIKCFESFVNDVEIFRDALKIGHFEYGPEDVIRSEIVKTLLMAYKDNESESESKII